MGSKCSVIKRFRLHRNLLLVFLISVVSLLKDSDFIGIFYCFCNFGTILIKRESFIVFLISVQSLLLKDSDFIGILLFFKFRYYPYYYYYSFFPHHPIDIAVLRNRSTLSHQTPLIHRPLSNRAHFGVDPDYHSGSRAKSVFSDSPNYLKNLSSDLQLQYL